MGPDGYGHEAVTEGDGRARVRAWVEEGIGRHGELALRVPLARVMERAGVPPALWPTLRATPMAAGGPCPDLDAHLDACAAEHQVALVDLAELLHVWLRFDPDDADHRRLRRSDGVFYTPPPLARWLVRTTLGATSAAAVADLACGGGAFLVAVLEVVAEAPRLVGIDIDPIAVEVTRARLFSRLCARGGAPAAAVERLLRDVRVADGLTAELPPLDVVVGNPPFGNAISAETSRAPEELERHKGLFPAVALGAYDLAFLFASRAVSALRPGGRYGLILPRSVLSLASAAGLRRQLEAEGPPELLWAPPHMRLFEGADVLVALVRGERGAVPGCVEVSLAPVGEHGGPKGEVRCVPGVWGEAWAPLVLPGGELLAHLDASPVPTVPLDVLAEVFGGAATDAAYRLRACAVDEADGDGAMLVTTGLIDRYGCAWGQRPCRFLKRTWQHPRWPSPTSTVDRFVQRAWERQACPKVLVAGLSRVIEAVADPDGSLGGVVSTWVVRPRDQTPRALWLLEAVLNSPLLSLVYMTRNGGKMLSGGNTTVGRRELRALPVFPDLLMPGDVSLVGGDGQAEDIDDEALDERGTSPLPLPDVFRFDPLDAAVRRVVARAVVDALARRPARSPIEADVDAWLAGAVSWLYGLTASAHEAVMAWFAARARGGAH